MYPIILSIGSLSISSFGVFLALAFLLSVFIGWRLGKVYDIDEEKILDLVILSFLGGMIGARLVFTVFNWEIFNTFEKVLLINRYPGLSFWGGLLGGTVSLTLLSRRFRINFWQIADFAAVGLALGIALGNLGCFFGGCAYGIQSDLPIASPVVGVIGKRLPINLMESFIMLLVFMYLWKQTVRFHFNGKILSLFLIFLGIIKFASEFYRGDSRFIYSWFAFGHLFAIMLFVAGVVTFYLKSKRSFRTDIKIILEIFYSSKRRKSVLLSLRKTWYNHHVSLKIRVSKTGVTLKTAPRVLKRRLNVKSNPTNLS